MFKKKNLENDISGTDRLYVLSRRHQIIEEIKKNAISISLISTLYGCLWGNPDLVYLGASIYESCKS